MAAIAVTSSTGEAVIMVGEEAMGVTVGAMEGGSKGRAGVSNSRADGVRDTAR